jgi:hypothetical protein
MQSKATAQSPSSSAKLDRDPQKSRPFEDVYPH